MFFKELSKFSVNIFKEVINMNLHEECLIKYLLNPIDLFKTTEILKLNNSLIEQKLLSINSINNLDFQTTRS